MSPTVTTSRDEHGAVLIHVVIALAFMIMIGAFVFDYGVLWGARSQSQNAADAGALAGASALAFDNPADSPSAADKWDRGRNVAWHVSHTNVVWGEHPAVTVASPFRTSQGLCSTNPENCVRVDVWRDGTNGGHALPTWLARLFGTTSQGTKAMAVAQTAPASGSNCLKPWLIPDRFQNNVGSANQFDAGDVYVAPTKNDDGSINYGTGYTPQDIGTTLVLKPGRPNQAIAPGNFYAIDDPLFDVNGGNDYRAAIAGCLLSHSVGDTLSIKDGNMIGPTNHGFDALMAGNGGKATVMIGMFNPAAYALNTRQSGNQDITIVNMLAFEVTTDSFQGNTITGKIVGAPSSMVRTCASAPCPTTTGLLSVIRLVR